MFNAKNFPSEDYYYYIIVGGGTPGCPLAATLSQSYRVLVLERGGVPYGNPNLMTQERFLATLTEVDTFDSHAQAEDGVPNARGHILGGFHKCRLLQRSRPAILSEIGCQLGPESCERAVRVG